MTKKKKSENYSVSPEEFIRVWQESSSVNQVAEALKMPRMIVSARACKYRKTGIRLKRMQKRGRPGLNVAAFNKLIDELSHQPGKADEPQWAPCLEYIHPSDWPEARERIAWMKARGWTDIFVWPRRPAKLDNLGGRPPGKEWTLLGYHPSWKERDRAGD